MISNRRSVIVLLLVLLAGLGAFARSTPAEEIYYGIEINGTLCGYSKIKSSPLTVEGRELILVEQHFFMMLSALGSRFNTEGNFVYHVDPSTGRFTYHSSEIQQGQVQLDLKVVVAGNQARATSSLSPEEKTVELPPGAILPNTLSQPHLKADLIDGGLAEKSYEILEVREMKIQKSTFKRVRAEKLEAAGSTHDAVVIESLNHETGLRSTLWLRASDGRVLRVEYANRRVSYLTDATVVKKIELANLDETIVSKVGVRIADVTGITYMKVKAEIEPTGLWITPESLNVPGQKFTGEVAENRVKGVFEVELSRYDGAGAPPFPPDFSRDEALKGYLEASEFIEADDPVLRKKAEELTAGAEDSWDAARRLSRWVAENIDYAIPGGGTARRTYDLRAGECGSHSILLATFCRSVGIPARVVWGCMYVPSHGGAFCQHAWNEIYMGEAGWIPVDCTAFETDFADSGHIRIGELDLTSIALNPVKFEILDHRVAKGGEEDPTVGTEKYAEYVGDYTHPRRGMVMKVVVQDGSLAVDIPRQTVLALDDPDDEGRWYAKLAPKVYCTFGRDDDERVDELQIHELVRMTRRSSPEKIDESVPEEYRPLLGKYFFAPRNVDFEVLMKDGRLAVHDTVAKKVIKLDPPDAKGRFLDEYGKNTMYFERDADGKVVRLVVDAVSRFKR